jgi:hypothetical protein
MSKDQTMVEFVEELIGSHSEVSQPEKDDGFRQFAKEFEVMRSHFKGKGGSVLDEVDAMIGKEKA